MHKVTYKTSCLQKAKDLSWVKQITFFVLLKISRVNIRFLSVATVETGWVMPVISGKCILNRHTYHCCVS